MRSLLTNILPFQVFQSINILSISRAIRWTWAAESVIMIDSAASINCSSAAFFTDACVLGANPETAMQAN
jgi:hypothetical protein